MASIEEKVYCGKLPGVKDWATNETGGDGMMVIDEQTRDKCVDILHTIYL